MIQNTDAEQFAGLFQTASEFQVFTGWRRITTWVVVDQDQCGSRREKGGLENLPRMDDGTVQAANGNTVDAGNFVFAVQVQDQKMFLSLVAEVTEGVENFLGG